MIRARGVKVGDTVLVRRAGDVIPFVAGALDESKRTGAERRSAPPSARRCGEPLTSRATAASCTARTSPAPRRRSAA